MLVARARNRALGGYVEKHHVLPKCLGGDDSPENIVALTAEEHYVAHQLLVKMHPSVSGLVWAAMRQARHARNNKLYGWLRRKWSLMASARTGWKHTEETKRKIAASRLGMIMSDEIRAKLSSAKKGRKLTPEWIAKIAAASTGRKYGPHSAETKAKIAAANRGRRRGPFTDEHRARISLSKTGKKRAPFTAEHRAKLSAANQRRKAAALS